MPLIVGTEEFLLLVCLVSIKEMVMRYVKVVFLNQRESFDPVKYSYLSSVDVKKGDIVVVQARNSFALAEVVSSSLKEDEKATRWVVQKVDVELSSILDKRFEEIKRLKQELVERIEKRQEEEALAQLTKNDPESAKILAEIKKLEES